jgi:hypothetical protein
MSDDIKSSILDTVDDSVSNLLYYDRKDDEELPRGAINDAVRDRVVTVEEMVAQFEVSLRQGLDGR